MPQVKPEVESFARIKVVGVGGSGKNAVNHITIEEVAKDSLKLPSKIASFTFEQSSRLNPQDSAWSVAYGLCLLGFTQGSEPSVGIKLAYKTKNNIIAWIKQFLP